MVPDYVFEPLGKTHNRAAFSCGIQQLDTYSQRQASQDIKRNLAAVFVLTDNITHTNIIGYYTLSAFSLEAADLPLDITRRLPRYPILPATLIGRLAVDERYKGQKYGQRLLFDAFRRCAEAEIASMAVVVDAIDHNATRFYQHFGFQPLAREASRLYVPMGMVKAAVSDL